MTEPLAARPRVRLRPEPRDVAADGALAVATTVGLAAAATATAVSSRGNVVVLAALIGLLARPDERRATTAFAAGLAALAVIVRWGTPSLGALAGAQAVLGFAGTTGPALAAASAWCAAACLVLCAPRCEHLGGRFVAPLVGALPVGLFGALVTIGPGPGGSLPARAIASAVAVLVAAGITLVRARARFVDQVTAVLAPLLGVTAVVLALAAP